MIGGRKPYSMERRRWIVLGRLRFFRGIWPSKGVRTSFMGNMEGFHKRLFWRFFWTKSRCKNRRIVIIKP